MKVSGFMVVESLWSLQIVGYGLRAGGVVGLAMIWAIFLACFLLCGRLVYVRKDAASKVPCGSGGTARTLNKWQALNCYLLKNPPPKHKQCSSLEGQCKDIFIVCGLSSK